MKNVCLFSVNIDKILPRSVHYLNKIIDVFQTPYLREEKGMFERKWGEERGRVMEMRGLWGTVA